MGCNCGGKRQPKNVKYVVTNSKGEQRAYQSKMQAEAAIIRNGGGTIREVEAT